MRTRSDAMIYTTKVFHVNLKKNARANMVNGNNLAVVPEVASNMQMKRQPK